MYQALAVIGKHHHSYHRHSYHHHYYRHHTSGSGGATPWLVGLFLLAVVVFIIVMVVRHQSKQA